MSDGLGDLLDNYRTEVIELRMGAVLPGAYASTQDLLDSLLDVRQRVDRVEEIFGNVLRLRASSARKHAAVRIQVDDAWDEAAVRQRSSSVRDEYSSAKERTAATNLEVLDLRRLERTADGDTRRCDEAVEFVRLRYRGLTDVRQDLLTIIKARQFESSLDR